MQRFRRNLILFTSEPLEMLFSANEKLYRDAKVKGYHL